MTRRYTHGNPRPPKLKVFTEAQKKSRMMTDQLKIEASKEGEIRCSTQPWWSGAPHVGVISRTAKGWRVNTHEAGSHERVDEDYPTLADLTEKWSVTP